jgi:hypothetical protein
MTVLQFLALSQAIVLVCAGVTWVRNRKRMDLMRVDETECGG